jgi:hypothetical protein
MDKVLFGDNQFFAVNHLSDEKSRGAGNQVQGRFCNNPGS